MKFCFATKELIDVYRYGRGKYPGEIIESFIERVRIVKGARDERDLRAIKGNHFEKLKGRKNLYSIKLNDKYRMEFSIDREDGDKIVTIKKISNHYS